VCKNLPPTHRFYGVLLCFIVLCLFLYSLRLPVIIKVLSYLYLIVGHVIRRMRSGCTRIVNGILREMSELITEERIALGSSNLLEVLIT